MNAAVLLGLAIYSPGQRRKKKVMHAMLAVARALAIGDVAAMSMVMCRIFRGMERMQLGAGLVAWKPQSRQDRQKSVVPRMVSQGSRVPSKASVWPTKWRAFSTV